MSDPGELVARARRDARAAWTVVALQALVLLAANAPWVIAHAVPAHPGVWRQRSPHAISNR